MRFVHPRSLRLMASMCLSVGLAGCAVSWPSLPAWPGLGDARAPAARPAAACAAASPVNPALTAPLAPTGLGGTGATAQANPGGIGGTGSPAAVAQGGPPGLGGTGIVGVVTGFASVCVNGVEVEVEPDTPVQRDGAGAGGLRELAVGQLVAVQASGGGTEVRARRIAVLDAVVGPVDAMDVPRGELRVLGQRVLVLARADLKDLRPGDWVRASGHRGAAGEVRASRVQRLAPEGLPPAQSLGPVVRDEAGAWRVGGTPLRLAPGQTLPAAGEEALVRGAWDGHRLLAAVVVAQPTRRALGDPERVVLQGYVVALDGQSLRLGYETVRLADDVRVLGGTLQALRVGQPVQVSARRDPQARWVASELSLGREGGRGARSSGETGDDGGRRGRNRSGDGESGGDDGGSSGSGGDSSGSGSGTSGGDSGSGSSGQGRGRGRGGKG